MTSGTLGHFFAGAAAAGVISLYLCAPVFAADKFQTNLGPGPIDDASRVTIQGRGDATATLDGNTLTVRGTFGGLVTPATAAHLSLGAGIAIPGNAISDIVATPATSGTISGTFTLTSEQVAALKSGKVYIQINSQKAGEPYGNLWGWLLPAHKTVGPNVPQQGPWFMPQSPVRPRG